MYVAPNGWTIAIAGAPPYRALDELGVEAEVHDLETTVRQDENLIGHLGGEGLDLATAESMLAADRAQLDRARYQLAVLRLPRAGFRSKRVYVGARPREHGHGRQQRRAVRAGPDDPDLGELPGRSA